MLRHSLAALIALFAVTSLVTAEEKLNTPPEGYTALFNGKDLTNWKGLLKGPYDNPAKRAALSADELQKLQAEADEDMKKHWSVKDGILVFDGKGRSLATAKDYGDFELYCDWKIEKNGDSGLYLRGQPQVQIWDSDSSPGARNEDKGTGSGGLWNTPLPPEVAKSADNSLKLKEGRKVGKIPLKKADKPVGEWNTFHIVMVGDEVTIKLNGELVVDKAKLQNYWERGKPLPAKGPIELQFHGDPLWFRNIYVKELP